MKVSMWSIRACALPMMNWFTQAMAWDLQGQQENSLSQYNITTVKRSREDLCLEKGKLLTGNSLWSYCKVIRIWVRQYEYKHLHSQSVRCYYASHPDPNLTDQKPVAFSPVPNLGAAVLEELKEFRNHNVEGSVQRIAVQQLRRVLADLLQCSKRALRHGHTQRGCQIENIQGQRRRKWDPIRKYSFLKEFWMHCADFV